MRRLCPPHLLSDILWAVSEPLDSARLDHPASDALDLDASSDERDAVEGVLRQLAPKVSALSFDGFTC